MSFRTTHECVIKLQRPNHKKIWTAIAEILTTPDDTVLPDNMYSIQFPVSRDTNAVLSVSVAMAMVLFSDDTDRVIMHLLAMNYISGAFTDKHATHLFLEALMGVLEHYSAPITSATTHPSRKLKQRIIAMVGLGRGASTVKIIMSTIDLLIAHSENRPPPKSFDPVRWVRYIRKSSTAYTFFSGRAIRVFSDVVLRYKRYNYSSSSVFGELYFELNNVSPFSQFPCAMVMHFIKTNAMDYVAPTTLKGIPYLNNLKYSRDTTRIICAYTPTLPTVVTDIIAGYLKMSEPCTNIVCINDIGQLLGQNAEFMHESTPRLCSACTQSVVDSITQTPTAKNARVYIWLCSDRNNVGDGTGLQLVNGANSINGARINQWNQQSPIDILVEACKISPTVLIPNMYNDISPVVLARVDGLYPEVDTIPMMFANRDKLRERFGIYQNVAACASAIVNTEIGVDGIASIVCDYIYDSSNVNPFDTTVRYAAQVVKTITASTNSPLIGGLVAQFMFDASAREFHNIHYAFTNAHWVDTTSSINWKQRALSFGGAIQRYTIDN